MIRRIAAVSLACLLWAALAQAATAPAEATREGEKLYMEIHRVLTHPRCLNCHPKGESPKQGDEARFHVPPMTRGPKDHGPAGMYCTACHQMRNFAASGVPGAPGWHLAPLSMAWEGKTPGEICRAVLDRRTNGNRSLAEIVKHLTEDALVAWAWEPGKDITGKDRQPVPIAKPEFNRIVNAWAKAGAVCPK